MPRLKTREEYAAQKAAAQKTFLGGSPPSDAVQLAALIVEAARRLEKLKVDESAVHAKIEETGKQIESLKASLPPPPVFQADRNELLADVALGKIPASAIDEFDGNVADAMMIHKQSVRRIEDEIRPLEETVGALRARSKTLGNEIGRSTAEHRMLCQKYLIALAEESGAAYLTAAIEMVRRAAEVVEFASLHKRIGGENFLGDGTGEFYFTGLGCDCTKGKLPDLSPKAWATRFDYTEREILESLERSGIRPPFPDAPPPVRARVSEVGTPIEIMRPPEPLRGPDGVVLQPDAISDFDLFTGEPRE